MADSIPSLSHRKSQLRKKTENPFRIVKKDEQIIGRICLTISILLDLPIRDSERASFIAYCRSSYRHSNILEQIYEFERSYRPDESIQWYTRPSGFPSKLINAICRTQNLLLISKVRYYLKHLHEQLTQLYINNLVWIPNSIIVYRGQRFSSNEFDRLVQSNGKILFTTTFLSTTSADDVATMFSGYDTCSGKSSSSEISVIFKILIRTRSSHLKPFAYIQEYSYIKDEKEILISIGTVLSFMDIHKRKGENFYEVYLVRGEDEEKIEKEMLDKAIESSGNGTTITMGEFLLSMNIDITPWNDFSDRPLTSFLKEHSQARASNIVNSAPADFPLSIIPNSTMGATYDHLIIWLDHHIGRDDFCADLKEKLTSAINLNMDEPLLRTETDRLILNNEIRTQTRDELITVMTIEECLTLINEHYHKKIFLIISGSLGQQIVPLISENYRYVDKIYIFCENIRWNVNWAMDYTDNLLMFDFHSDLFARVTYDIGMRYMEQGIGYSLSNDHIRALGCLYTAKTLVMRANNLFHTYSRFNTTRIEQYICAEERGALMQSYKYKHNHTHTSTSLTIYLFHSNKAHASIAMHSSTSLSSISSTSSSNSSTYGSRTILDAKDLPSAAPRCRSSIVAFLDNDETLLSPPSSPPPPPPPRRRSQLPPTRSMAKCRHLFRTCLSSTSSPLSVPTQTKSSNSIIRQQYFANLCRTHRLLLVLTDYQCQCGCQFSMREGSFVILYETRSELSPSSKKSVDLTVISNELVCSKVPSEYVCDIDLLRERVRSRRVYSDEQTFDV